MRTTISLAVLLLVWSLTGCFGRKVAPLPQFAPIGVAADPGITASETKTPPVTKNAPDTNNVFTITPAQGSDGRVASVNANLNFAVVTFPIGEMPSKDMPLFVYRNGIKAAELKATGPQQDDNIVADIVSGTALPGDEVREK